MNGSVQKQTVVIEASDPFYRHSIMGSFGSVPLWCDPVGLVDGKNGRQESRIVPPLDLPYVSSDA
jgi:hypothetical protein